MRLLTLLLSVVLFSVGCGDKKVSLEAREGLVYIEGSDALYTGTNSLFYENGQKRAELNFKGGKADGLNVEWYENGQKKREGNWKDDKPIGLHVSWHENGQKSYEENYKDGKPVEGSEKYWNSKGEPR